jgi:hypothetical protein
MVNGGLDGSRRAGVDGLNRRTRFTRSISAAAGLLLAPVWLCAASGAAVWLNTPCPPATRLSS